MMEKGRMGSAVSISKSPAENRTGPALNKVKINMARLETATTNPGTLSAAPAKHRIKAAPAV